MHRLRRLKVVAQPRRRRSRRRIKWRLKNHKKLSISALPATAPQGHGTHPTTAMKLTISCTEWPPSRRFPPPTETPGLPTLAARPCYRGPRRHFAVPHPAAFHQHRPRWAHLTITNKPPEVGHHLSKKEAGKGPNTKHGHDFAAVVAAIASPWTSWSLSPRMPPLSQPPRRRRRPPE